MLAKISAQPLVGFILMIELFFDDATNAASWTLTQTVDIELRPTE